MGTLDDINPRWLSVKLACAYSSMSKNTIKKYLITGEIAGSKKGGKWYVDKNSIDAFFQEDTARAHEIADKILSRMK
ncbi:MAG: helix-turn-helix domain-containing protein [Proteobacteria bacterium]|nr:helix-turn-helix domain-containing protein [Pseudomonadota bacterium]